MIFQAGVIAKPVLGRRLTGRVVGRTRNALYFDCDGFVVIVVPDDRWLMPSGILIKDFLPDVSPGTPIVESSGSELLVGSAPVNLADAEIWETSVPRPRNLDEVAERALAILGFLEATDPGALLLDSGLYVAADLQARKGVKGLWEGLIHRDVDSLLLGGQLLVGSGPGLTPEGDDVLAAVAACVSIMGPVAGMDGLFDGAWRYLEQLARERTTGIAATLFQLALGGNVPKAASQLVNVATPFQTSTVGLLRGLGKSTGNAWLVGCTLAAWALAFPSREISIS